MVIGHEKQRDFLKKLTETGELSHAYLFSGPEHLGKKKIALDWISLLFKEPPTNNSGGEQHPDLILIEPLPEKKEIEISQIRDLIWKLSLKPYSAPLKAAIIDRAHLMNEEAQNCFLKTLEEPKGNTLLILITEAPQLLLPTILSRCELIKFYPVKNSQIENYLKKQGLSKKEIQEITSISLARPGLAIDFSKDTQKLEERREKIKELIKISNSDLSSRFRYAKDLSQSSDIREILNIWTSFFRNILLKKCIGKSEVRSSKYSLLELKNILKLLQRINYLILNTNVNTRLALEILMLEL